jgi:hypothetical protein
MDKMVGFVKSYFPVFMLGAVFGKVIELSGFSKSIVAAVIGVLGRERAVLSIVVVCAILTYGGVSLFVVVFAVYPFAAEMFRQSGIKRLIPARCARRIQPPWTRCRAPQSRTSFTACWHQFWGRPGSRRRIFSSSAWLYPGAACRQARGGYGTEPAARAELREGVLRIPGRALAAGGGRVAASC